MISISFEFHLIKEVSLFISLTNNGITKLTDISDSLPNIEYLILMNNRLAINFIN